MAVLIGEGVAFGDEERLATKESCKHAVIYSLYDS